MFSTGEVVEDCLETALDIGTDAYVPIPSNTSRKKFQNADAKSDAHSDTCKCVIAGTIFLSVISIIGN